MIDDYKQWKRGPTTFGRRSKAITPSDTDDLTEVAKAVVCLTGGNISVVPAENDPANPVNFVGVPAGYIPPFQVRRVKSTGTTCTVMTVSG